MTKLRSKVLSLEMALKASVYTSEEQSLISKIADKNGWNITTLRNSLCPTTVTHKANIYHFEAVLAETQDSRIMDSICAIHGNAGWFELPKVSLGVNQAEYIQKIGKLAHKQGVLSQAIAEAISDDRITNNEYDVIHKDVLDLVRCANTLLAMVRNQRDEEL